MCAMPTLEQYPQKTMKAIAKGGDTDFVQDESHLAISFDDYVKMFCKKIHGKAKRNQVEVQPFGQVHSTLDALVLSSRRTDGGDERPRYVFFEFKNRDIFRRGDEDKIRFSLVLKESVERDLDHKLYDSAIMMVHLGRTDLLTGFATMDAYIVCASEKNKEYEEKLERLLGDDDSPQSKQSDQSNRSDRFAAYASIVRQDDVLTELVETIVAAFHPKMASRLEGYLYHTVRFITERQLTRILDLTKNVHP